jgi:DNA adenine methylase
LYHRSGQLSRYPICLESGDALDLIPRWDLPETVIYVDPPYTGEHRLSMKEGYAHDLTPTLYRDLVERLASIENAAVILSGYPCEEIKPLVEDGWRPIELTANRNVQARLGGKLPKVPETVWLSPLIPQSNGQLWSAEAVA